VVSSLQKTATSTSSGALQYPHGQRHFCSALQQRCTRPLMVRNNVAILRRASIVSAE
jgi:hypothetical protein